MQTNTTAKNIIFTGQYPYSNFGPQTDRHFPRPDPNSVANPITGPNDIIRHTYVISMRTLTDYTGSQADNYYLMTLPCVIDRPKTIQILGSTIYHVDPAFTGNKTVYVQTPIVKDSGFRFVNTSNVTVSNSEELMGVIKVPSEATSGAIFSIATTQVIMRPSIKDQGYSQIVGIPIRFLNNRGESLGLETDLSLDGELIIQIECETYNPNKLQRLVKSTQSS